MRGQISKIVFIGCCLTITACGSKKTHQEFKSGPTNESELGLITMGISSEELNELLSLNPQAKFRTLSKEMEAYELTGLSKHEILEHAPNATVEPNKLVQYKDYKSQNKRRALDFLDQKTQSPNSFFNGCNVNEALPMPKLKISNKAELSSPLKVGQTVKIDILQAPSSNGKSAWFVVPPVGSLTQSQITQSLEANIEIDMPGSFALMQLYRNGNLCNYKVSQVNASLDEVFNEDMSTQIVEQSKESVKDVNLYHLDLVKAHQAQSLLNSKKEIVVAVLDSGVNYNHPLLNSVIWTNSQESYDGIDNDGNGYIDDVHGYDFYYGDNMPMDDVGHGSHVAGLIAGLKTGVANANVKIMPLKVGSGNGLDYGSIISGISYAIAKKVSVINLSLGGSNRTDVMEFALEKARQKGILVVAAAGNGDSYGRGINIDARPVFPAAYPSANLISVAAVKDSLELTNYSNYGQHSVDISAPGGYLDYSTQENKMLLSAYLRNPAGVLLSPQAGTSMAAPIVSGVAALVLSENPNLLPHEVIQILTESSLKSSKLDNITKSGGLVNALDAVLKTQEFSKQTLSM